MSNGLFLAAPPGASWTLELNTFEDRLRQRFPDVAVDRIDSRVSTEHYVTFEALIDGTPRTGTYSDGSVLAVSEGSPAQWADTLAWFVDLLPPDSTVVAMAEGNTQIVPVPRPAAAHQIQTLLDQLVADR